MKSLLQLIKLLISVQILPVQILKQYIKKIGQEEEMEEVD